MSVNYSRTIPKSDYKSATIGKDLRVTGYISRVYDYNKGYEKPTRDMRHSSLSLSSGDSKLTIRGRKELMQLKKVIDFALETKKKKVKS